jgi:small conductance mechanosensitive channel
MNFESFLPLTIVIVACVMAFFVAGRFFKRRIAENPSTAYFHQLLEILLSLVTLIAVVSAMPLSSELKGQILGLIGIVLSGAIALSSTTLLGNGLAGIMLRISRNFKTGDFIQVDTYFGKVSARNILNIEIQTIDRGLISLPNMFLVSKPVKVLPKSGIFVNVEVSLGYDVSRSTIESALLSAAEKLGIENAYVEVKSLLDHAVLYCLHALVTDLESYFSSRSKLHAAVIDELHNSKVEIVSPRFVASRPIDSKPIIPRKERVIVTKEENIDELLFEKANLADLHERLKEKKQKYQDKLSTLEKDSEESKTLEAKIVKIDNKINLIDEEIAEHDQK